MFCVLKKLIKKEKMKIVSVISQKGGAGKTTLAIHLAVAAEKSGKETAIVDLDPQASATNWKDSRSDETPVVVSAQASRLEPVLKAAEAARAKITLIDTAPHSEGASLAAARAADMILIPCRPSILDLRAISSTIDIAKIAQKPVAVVLNGTPPRGNIAEEAKSAVDGYHVEVCPIRIGQRASFIHALSLGQTAQEYDPQGKGAEEIEKLFRWLCKKLEI
jgi:chromosome partitioning protein